MVREILVIERKTLFPDRDFQGFLPLKEKDYLSTILSNFQYKERTDELEHDSTFQQPIPYIWVINSKTRKVFAYVRANRTGESFNEKRYAGKWSGGVGGHIDRIDEIPENPILSAMEAELREELRMQNYPSPRIVGYINDDSDSIGKVHFGLVALAMTDEENIKITEQEGVTAGFYSAEELDEIFSLPENIVENWTSISWPFVKSYIKNLPNQ